MYLKSILLSLILCLTSFAGVLTPPRGMVLNHGHPQSRGLVYAGLFNEGTGPKVFDLSRNGNTGTFVSNPLWVTGTTGLAIDFSDDAINVGGNIYNSCVNELTIVAKIRRESGGFEYGRIIDKYPGPTILGSVSPYYFRFYGKIGGTVRDWEWPSPQYTVDTWYTVAVRLGSGFQELYTNGILRNSALTGGPYAGTYDIGSGVNAYIGNRASDMARDWDGQIEWLYIYNRALIPSEIALLYQNPFVMFQQDSTALLAAAAAPPPSGGQVITIQMSMVPLLLIPALIFIQRRKLGRAN